MSYLLDTNACIGYLNGRAPGIVKRLQAEKPADVFLCSVVKAELHFGAQRSSDPIREFKKLEQFWHPYASLPFDDRCAVVYGEIRAQLEAAGTPLGPNDLLIAAIALTNGLTLVTHNTREFQRVPGLKWEDWQAVVP